MSYEVYIDVTHHPRHLDGDKHKLSYAGRWADPDGTDPIDHERLRTVAAALRSMADRCDPDQVCSNCGEPRHRHAGYPDELPRCFNKYGPIAQAAWWSAEPQERTTLDTAVAKVEHLRDELLKAGITMHGYDCGEVVLTEMSTREQRAVDGNEREILRLDAESGRMC